MKRFLMYAIIFGFIWFCVGNITTEATSDEADLDRIYSILKENKNIKIEGWSLTARELLLSISDENEFKEQLNQLKAKLPSFKWNMDHQPDKITAVGVYRDADVRETVTFALARTNRQESYITYEIQGTTYRPQWKQEMKERIQNRKKFLFRQNTTFFTCIKGRFNDTIDEVLTSRINAWMKDFKAVEIESLKEKKFISITAKSPLFKQTYVNKQYNLQLAMRSDGMGSSTSFVIGTPIITFEY
ncbi:YwmB family TATA-box binding protein [Bacillus testis]|uniref:YwmB family TATA-box binding protein n=1 Tax=Bacillus testis TaxID=1622072 RepID=UPI00067EB76B|nr:YwmB family TATA-box binding protein [Bacillus testis]